MKWLVVMAVLGCPAVSLADDAAPAPDTVTAPETSTARPVSRPWLYSDDATIPSPLHAVVQMRGTYTSAGDRSVTRPFASNVSAPGGLAEIGGEVGLLPLLSIEATGVMGFGDGLSGGMVGGLRFAPLAMLRSGFKLVIGGGYLRDRSADNGVYGRVAASYDVGRLRVATMAHGEHVFGVGRDALDLLVTAGASVRVVGPVRAGVEYVGQDLEELGADAAEGGARHFVGPVLSFDMLDHKLMFAGGPAAGLSYASPRVVGRLSLAYAF